MITIAILPEAADSYRALAGGKESTGRTPGEALDALSAQLSAQERSALVVVQNHTADEFFSADQQQRLGELMELRKARSLAAEEESELESLVEAELHGARRRAEVIASAAAPEQQTSDTSPREDPTRRAATRRGYGRYIPVGLVPLFDGYDLASRRLSARGESPRLREVVEHRDAVYSFALRVTGSRDVAEDVVQDVYAKIVGHALHHSLEKVENVKEYVLRVASKILRDVWREGRKAAEWDVGSVDDPQNLELRKLAVVDYSPGFFARMDAEEILQEFMANATAHDRRVFGMVFHEGLSSKQMAERMGSDVETARRERNRVTAKIRYRLKGRRVKNR